MVNRPIVICLWIIAVCFASAVHPQTDVSSDFVLTAEGKIEVDRTQQLIIALEGAELEYQDLKISGEKIEASYVEIVVAGKEKIALKTLSVHQLDSPSQAHFSSLGGEVFGNVITIVCRGDTLGTIETISVDGLGAVLSEQINIAATKNLHYNPTSGAISGTQNVVIQNTDMTLRSDQVMGHLTPTLLQIQAPPQTPIKLEIVEMEAVGRVNIESKNLSSVSHKAKYSSEKQEIFLSGEVEIEQDQSRITGEDVHVNLLTGVNTVQDAGPGRVKAVIFGK